MAELIYPHYFVYLAVFMILNIADSDRLILKLAQNFGQKELRK